MSIDVDLICSICGAAFVGAKQRRTCGDACRRQKKLNTYAACKKREYVERGAVYVVKVAEKTCTRRQECKPAAEFHLNRSQPDGLQQVCKACRKADAQRPEFAAKAAERKARWYAERAEEVAVLSKARYEANREKHNADSRARYYANHEKRRAQHKAAYERSKSLVRRVCQCGRGYLVQPNCQRYFCSAVCRRNTRWSVAAFIVQGLAKSGTSIHSLRTMADAA